MATDPTTAPPAYRTITVSIPVYARLELWRDGILERGVESLPLSMREPMREVMFRKDGRHKGLVGLGVVLGVMFDACLESLLDATPLSSASCADGASIHHRAEPEPPHCGCGHPHAAHVGSAVGVCNICDCPRYAAALPTEDAVTVRARIESAEVTIEGDDAPAWAPFDHSMQREPTAPSKPRKKGKRS